VTMDMEKIIKAGDDRSPYDECSEWVFGDNVERILTEFLEQHLKEHHSGFIVQEQESDRTKLICGLFKKSHFPSEPCSPKSPKRQVNIQCPECLKYFSSDRAGFMSQPAKQCECKWCTDNRWQLKGSGLPRACFCPFTGKPLAEKEE